VSVNENGDRNDDYAIYDYQDGTFIRVALYDGFGGNYVPEKEVGKTAVDLYLLDLHIVN